MSKRNKVAQKLARARLRNAIRSVIYNRMWLADTEEQKFSLNVKKNIAMLIRKEQKIGLLTMADKSLIRTNHTIRTVEERKKLVHLIANLTCFSKLSPKVRARLVPVISFLYIGPGREIIKDGDPPRYVYFILTGEVEVMEKVWNPLENEYVEEIISVIGPGDCIGDIEFIEKCLRRNTYTTRSNCELLVVFEDDFDIVLRTEMTKLWMEKKRAFEALPYFSNFSPSQLQRGCRMSKLRQYESLETIYYEDKGHVSPVYFIVSGECMILQCLKLKVMDLDGEKTYELVDISNEREGLFQENKVSSKKIVTNDDDDFDIDEEIKSLEDVSQEVIHKASSTSMVDMPEETTETKPRRAMIQLKTLEEIEKDCLRLAGDTPDEQMQKQFSDDDDEIVGKKPTTAIKPIIADQETQKQKQTDISQQVEGDIKEGEIEEGEKQQGEIKERDVNEGDVKEGAVSEEGVKDATQIDGEEVKVNENDMNDLPYGQSATGDVTKNEVDQHELHDNKGSEKELKTDVTGEAEAQQTEVKEIEMPEDENIAESEVRNESLISTTMKTPKFLHRKSWKPVKELEIRYETRFIDVGSLLFGGIFGLGEKLQHRVIMARSTVQCLLVPRYWLFEQNQNPGNIWQRRRFYLNTSIPSRENLFTDFVREKEWRKFKNDVVNRVLEDAVSGNPTKIQDIPIICRIIEDRGDD